MIDDVVKGGGVAEELGVGVTAAAVALVRKLAPLLFVRIWYTVPAAAAITKNAIVYIHALFRLKTGTPLDVVSIITC